MEIVWTYKLMQFCCETFVCHQLVHGANDKAEVDGSTGQ